MTEDKNFTTCDENERALKEHIRHPVEKTSKSTSKKQKDRSSLSKALRENLKKRKALARAKNEN